MKVIKKMLWYSKVEAYSPIIKDLCCAYCDKRNMIWNAYLGWRRTDFDIMTFWLPTRIVNEIQKDYNTIKQKLKELYFNDK